MMYVIPLANRPKATPPQVNHAACQSVNPVDGGEPQPEWAYDILAQRSAYPPSSLASVIDTDFCGGKALNLLPERPGPIRTFEELRADPPATCWRLQPVSMARLLQSLRRVLGLTKPPAPKFARSIDTDFSVFRGTAHPSLSLIGYKH